MKLNETLKLTLQGFSDFTWMEYTELVDVLTSVQPNMLNQELSELPRVYTYFSGMAAIAKEQASRAESDLELLVFHLKQEATEEIEKDGKRATKERVEAQALKDPEYYTQSLELLRKEKVYTSLKGLLQGLSIKRDCLVQLSANQRGEIQMYQ